MLYFVSFLQPRLNKGPPSKINIIIVDHPTTRHCSWGGHRQVFHFKQKRHLYKKKKARRRTGLTLCWFIRQVEIYVSVLCLSVLTRSGIEILSPFMSVSTLLSSITEFMLSIHRVSTGPSNTIHFSSGFSSENGKIHGD